MIICRAKSFRVSGFAHRVSGSGVQVRVLVPDLIPEPIPMAAAETIEQRMIPDPH